MKAKQLLIALFMAIAFISCEKEDDVKPESTPAPTYNTEYTVTSDTTLWYVAYNGEDNKYFYEMDFPNSSITWSKKLNMGIGDTLYLGAGTMDVSRNFDIDVKYTGEGKIITSGKYKDGDEISYFGVIMAE